MQSSHIRQVEEFQYGVYVWRTDDGRVVGDDEGNVMLIASVKDDQRKIEMLRTAARGYGIDNGHAEFRSGVRPVTDDEYEEQLERQSAGYVPDKYDLGSLLDDYKFRKGVDKQ